MDLRTFMFDGEPVRVVEVDGVPHFVGKDVAERLAYTNATKALNDHCRGVTIRYPIIDSLGRTQQARVIAEPDVLRLIIKSSLPAADRFERLVFEEILPTIRKTGSYGAPVDLSNALAAALRDPSQALALLTDQVKLNAELRGQIEEMKPQVQAFDRIANADGSTCITDAAKVLQIRPKDLFSYLRQNGWIYRRAGSSTDLGYQSKILAGLLEHKVKVVTRSDGTETEAVQVRVTPKGLSRLAQMLPPAAAAA